MDGLTEEMLRGFVKIAPDFVAEIVSENDTYYEVETKVREYLSAGVRLIWVLNPTTKSVRIYRPSGVATELQATETISGEDVFPGFQTPVAEFYKTQVRGK